MQHPPYRPYPSDAAPVVLPGGDSFSLTQSGPGGALLSFQRSMLAGFPVHRSGWLCRLQLILFAPVETANGTQAQVGSLPVQPSARVIVLSDLGRVPVEPVKGFLGQIFRLNRVSDHAHQQPVDRTPVLEEHVIEGARRRSRLDGICPGVGGIRFAGLHCWERSFFGKDFIHRSNMPFLIDKPRPPGK